MKKKIKSKITDFINNTYGLLIFVSWILLIICVVIKIFGGNWFELATNNEKFIAFCDFVDKTKWLKMIFACLICVFTTYPAICVFSNRKRLDIKFSIIVIILLIIKSILSWYIGKYTYILDIIILIIIPIIINKKILRVILGNLIVIAFQMITMFIRNINGNLTNLDNFLFQSLIQIDYYLMIILFYLYNLRILKRKESE